jgi:hypothetical protein
MMAILPSLKRPSLSLSIVDSMKGVPTVIVGLLLHSVVIAVEPNIIDAYAERSQAERPIALATAKEQLKGLSRWHRDDKEELAKELRGRIAALENPLEPYYALATFNWSDLKVGEIGRIDSWKSPTERVQEEIEKIPSLQPRRRQPKLKVFQVDAEDSALIRWPGGEILIGLFTAVEVEKEKARRLVGEALFMARGMSTKGWVDGRDAELEGVFAVTGTETYVSGAGNRTVPLLEKLDLSDHVQRFTRKHESRIWTTENGTKSRAIYYRYDRGTVMLMNAAGKITDINITDLSVGRSQICASEDRRVK